MTNAVHCKEFVVHVLIYLLFQTTLVSANMLKRLATWYLPNNNSFNIMAKLLNFVDKPCPTTTYAPHQVIKLPKYLGCVDWE